MSAVNLQPGEKVLMQARRHWFVFLLETIGLILAAVLPILLVGMVDLEALLRGAAINPENVSAVTGYLFAAWGLFIWTIFSIAFTNYYLDLFIVTNRRVIDVEQIGLFARNVATAPLENIEDVKVEVLGFIATMLKYGHIHVQTAAASREIVIKGIVLPYKVKEAILAGKDAIHHRKEGGA